jgi:hypothetical protein
MHTFGGSKARGPQSLPKKGDRDQEKKREQIRLRNTNPYQSSSVRDILEEKHE